MIKALAEMSKDEMRAFVEKLRSKREALLAEGIKAKKEREAKGVAEPRRATTKREPSTDKADLLAFLRGEKEEL